MRIMRRIGMRCVVIAVLLAAITAAAQTDPLPAWNDGPTRQAIVEFVQKVTDKSSPDFVPPAERIATFDNDGTLWTEHPMYTQLAWRPGIRSGRPNSPSRPCSTTTSRPWRRQASRGWSSWSWPRTLV